MTDEMTDPAETRLEALDRYRILDTPAEQGFDDIVLLASRLCETPIALVSLVAEKRQWFKAGVGFTCREAPLDVSICAFALQQNATFVIPDLTVDERTKHNPLVTAAPFFRFYAGALLKTPGGVAIGTLCIIDTVARPAGLTDTQRTSLEVLARQTALLLEGRGSMVQMAETLRLRLIAEAAERSAFADAARRRAALLEVGDRQSSLRDIAEMAFVAAEIMGRTLGVSAAGYATMDLDGDTILVERDWTAPGVASFQGWHRMRDYGSFVEDLHRGETVAIDNVVTDPRTADTAPALRAIGAGAVVTFPLVEHGRLVALFFIIDEHERHWTNEELGFIRNVAQRTRLAVERQRAENGLRDLAASLEQQVADRTADRNRLWQLSTDIMLVARFDGIMIAVNPAWTVLLGWSVVELFGRPIYDFIHPDDLEATHSATASMVDGSTVWLFENRYRHRDGSYRWICWTAVPGEGLINAVGRDVSDQKAQTEALALAEEHLRQSQKMEAVGQLTGGLAHDFNNLLTGITGSLELLQTRIAQGRLADVDRYVKAAHGAAKRAAALTHRLLAFSRRQTLAPKPTDVNRLVTGMEELIRRTMGPSVDVRAMAADDLWTTLVDPSQLENALLNLCINARDAMPHGGMLTVETSNRWLDAGTARQHAIPPGAYVLLRVSDNGAGMAPEVIARAFDPFFTTKPIGQGTGLGLSMIHGFVCQSGGQAHIVSEIGQGTAVSLYLPRHHGAAEHQDETSTFTPAPCAGRDETVLIVDDEPAVRMLVTEILQDLGYTAIEATDGAAGLRVLQSDAPINLLVTDVGLPGGMNGRQMADAGRLLRPELKVLFITGYAETAVLSHGHLQAGMHVLTKPFAMDVLASRISELISGP